MTDDELATLRRDLADARAGALGYARLATRAADLLEGWLRMYDDPRCQAPDLVARTREFLGRP